MGNLKVDKKALEKLQKQLEELEEGKAKDKFFEDCAKEMAARLLALVIPKTPVGVYPDDPSRKGGALRRGWTGGKKMDAETFARSLKVEKSGNTYTITVADDVPYASYVEYGHRQKPGRYVPAIGKRLKKGLVQGKRMLEISEQELEALAPKILQDKLEKFLKGVFNG